MTSKETVYPWRELLRLPFSKQSTGQLYARRNSLFISSGFTAAAEPFSFKLLLVLRVVFKFAENAPSKDLKHELEISSSLEEYLVSTYSAAYHPYMFLYPS